MEISDLSASEVVAMCINIVSTSKLNELKELKKVRDKLYEQ